MKKLLAVGALLACSTLASAGSTPSYVVTSSIAGPDGGGWDYARVDPGSHRLYVARTSAISVFDTASGKEVGSIGTIAHGHAVLPVAGGRLLVTSGDDATVRFLSAKDGHEIGRVAVGKKPDAAILSTDGRTAFVMNAAAGTISMIDVPSMRQTHTIAVKPALEYAVLASDGTLFVNDEDANEMEVVDVRSGRAGTPIAMPGCEAPSGLAYDGKTNRLIAACANGKAAIVDAKTRSVVDYVETGKGPDAVILDATRRLAFVPCGKDGTLDVLSLDGPAVRRIGSVKTAVGARTGALDPATGAIYLPTAAMDPSATPNGRPTPRPGTFKVLVVKPMAGRS
ncbi:PQQ-binding-like beta-propeller repeat protein [uncultured Sphingomonas sp.]|uniref:YncE family protein n=1 Tax=uncultured Sphingomonas sp. TaxID=158754 RepID=UPI0025987B6C|nr:PQQ-binding-like beta-propeller repeat protein [uncultured Sphingomonas sp.]